MLGHADALVRAMMQLVSGVTIGFCNCKAWVLYVGIVNVIAIGKFSNVVFLIVRHANLDQNCRRRGERMMCSPLRNCVR